jgi:long-subunit acyl-CoA synthetase (AMP-forming)
MGWYASGDVGRQREKKECERGDRQKETLFVMTSANVSVDSQVDELELTKLKATELLKAHDGDAVHALKAFIAV